jgi:hypothetical protein
MWSWEGAALCSVERELFLLRIVADNFDNSGHLEHDEDYLTDWSLNVGNMMFEKFVDEQES